MPEIPVARKANIILGIALGSLALLSLTLIFLARPLPGFWAFLSAPGVFLRGTFAWAVWFIPLWLAAASVLAFLPSWHPAALALLVAALLPFFPIALFARLSSKQHAFPEAFAFLRGTSMTALGLAAGAFAFLFAVLGARLALALARGAIAAPRESARVRGARRAVEGSVSESADPLKRGWAGLKPEGQEPAPREKGRASGKNKNAISEEEARPRGKAAAPSAGASPRLESLEELESLGKLDLPELPPLPPLRSLGETALPAEGGAISATDDPAALAAVSAEAAPAANRFASAGMGAKAGAPAETETDSGTGIKVKLAGDAAIEFTSVPPSKIIAAPEDKPEAVKAAAVERILARKKEKPYSIAVDGVLNLYPDGEYWVIDEKTKRSAEILRDTLAEFNIKADVTGIRKGPVITMFEILPAPGVRLSKIANLADNIALRLAASNVRIVAPIPGKHAVGIEVPNAKRSIVSLREIVENDAFASSKMEVPVILGKDIAGEPQFIDLVQTPHLLIAGATGSGKSVCVNSLILSILFRRSPQEVRLMLIDPKIVELKLYNDIPHLLTPVITEPKRAFQALQYCICEMERRYAMLDSAGVRDIKSYNRRVRERKLAQERLPYIVVIIDEFADLMATTGKELESTLARLAAMSRAVGIHLVLATQRPSIDVITGLIKANIPSRIAFMVASKFDSRIIIDMVGAEKLLGRGDMLVASAWDPFPIRMQGTFVSEEEVEKAVERVKEYGEPEYIDDEIFIEEDEEELSVFGDEEDDPLFEKALEIVLQQGKASASYIQRRLKVGYNRASRLVEIMESKGIVGPANGSKPRDVLRNPEVLGIARAAQPQPPASEARAGPERGE